MPPEPEFFREPDGSGRMALVYDAWLIEARWMAVGTGESRRRHPTELSIRPRSSDERLVSRGLTSGVLRQIEVLVGRASEEFASAASRNDFEDAWTEKAQAAAIDLQGKPLSDPDYAKYLLQTLEIFERVYPRAPVNELATQLALKPGTLRARIRTARLRSAKIRAEHLCD